MYRSYSCVAVVSCRIIRTANNDASSAEAQSHTSMCHERLQKHLLCNFKPKCIFNVEDHCTSGSIAPVDLKMKIN
jgi:hypothetical protein